MDFHSMKRKELQALCKKHNIPANLTNLDMANKLSSLLKEKEKPITRGRSCLKDIGEIASVNVSDETRKIKKVRFSPENEMIEFVDLEADPRETRLVARRRSMGRPVMKKIKDLVIENVDSNNNIVDNSVRNTRSRAQKIVEEVVRSVPMLPIEKKRARRGVGGDGLEAKDVDRNVMDLSGNLASENAAVEETGVTVRRSLRNREVVGENEKEGEIVGIQVLRKKNAEGSKKISENNDLAADGKIIQPEKPLTRSKRNVMKVEGSEQLNGELGQNEMIRKGRITRSRTQRAMEETVAEVQGASEMVLQLEEPSMHPGRNGNRRKSVRAMEETEVEVQGESEMVLQLEEPSMHPGRNGNRRKSAMHRNEKVVPEGPVAENENRKVSRSSSSGGGSTVEIPKENEKDSLPGGPLRRSRRNTSSEPFVEHARRLRQNGLRRESVAVSDALDGITNAIVKNKPRKRRRDPILEEENVVTDFAPLIEESPRRSKRNAVKSNLVVQEVVTGKVVGKKAAKGRSKTPIVEVEVPSLTESTSVIEEPPLVDAQRAMGDVVESATDPVSSSRKQSSKDTTEKKSSTNKVVCPGTSNLEKARDFIMVNSFGIPASESAEMQSDYSHKEEEIFVSKAVAVTEKVNISFGVEEGDPASQSLERNGKFHCNDIVEPQPEVVLNLVNGVASSQTKQAADGYSRAPLCKNISTFKQLPIANAGLSEQEVPEIASSLVLSSSNEVLNDTNKKRKGSTRESSLKQQLGSNEVCTRSPHLEGVRDPSVVKPEGTAASNSMKLQSEAEQEMDDSVGEFLGVAEKENIAVVVGNENLLHTDIRKDNEYDLDSQSQNISEDFNCTTLFDLQSASEKAIEISVLDLSDGGRVTPNVVGDNVEYGLLETMSVSHVMPAENVAENPLLPQNIKVRVTEVQLTNGYFSPGKPSCKSIVAPEYQACCIGDEVTHSSGDVLSINNDARNQDETRAKVQSNVQTIMPAGKINHFEVQENSNHGNEFFSETLCKADTFISNVGDDMCSQERIEDFSTDMENKPEEASYLKRAMQDVDKEISYEGLEGNLFMDEICSQEAIEESSTEMENKFEAASHVKEALQAVDRETCEELEGNPSMYDNPISISNELDGQVAKEKENEGLERNYIHVSEEIREGSTWEFTDGERTSLIISEERDADKKEHTLSPIVTPECENSGSYDRTPLKDDGSKEDDGLKHLFATPANDRNSNEEASRHETGTVDVMMPKGLPREVVGTMESEHEKSASKSNALPTADEEFIDEAEEIREESTREFTDGEGISLIISEERDTDKKEHTLTPIVTPECENSGNDGSMSSYDRIPLKDNRSKEDHGLKHLFATPANDRNSNEEASSHETGTVDVMMPGLPREVVGTVESEYEKSASKSNALPTADEEFIDEVEEIREGSTREFTGGEGTSLVISEERDTDKKEHTLTPIVTPECENSGNDGSMSSYDRIPLKDDGSKEDHGLKHLFATPANDRNSNEEASSHETGTIHQLMPKGLPREVVGTMESEHEKSSSKSNALPTADEEFIDEVEEIREGRTREFTGGEGMSLVISEERDTDKKEHTLTPIVTSECENSDNDGSMSSYDNIPLKDDGSKEDHGLKHLFATPANDRNSNEEACSHETGTVDVMTLKGLPREVEGTMESEHTLIPIVTPECENSGNDGSMSFYDRAPLMDDESKEDHGLKHLFATPANDRNSNEEASCQETGTVDVMMPKGLAREVVGTMESEHEKSASKSNALPAADEEFIDEGSIEKADVEFTCFDGSSCTALDGNICKDGCFAEDKESEGSRPFCENYLGESTCLNPLELSVGVGIPPLTSKEKDGRKIENFEEAAERTIFVAECHVVGAYTDAKHSEAIALFTPNYVSEYQASGTSNKEMLSIKHSLSTDDMQDQDDTVDLPSNKYTTGTKAKDAAKGMEGDSDVQCDDLVTEEENTDFLPEVASSEPCDSENGFAQVIGSSGASLVETMFTENEASEEKLTTDLSKSSSKCFEGTTMQKEEDNEETMSSFGRLELGKVAIDHVDEFAKWNTNSPRASDEVSEKITKEKLILADAEADLDYNDSEGGVSMVVKNRNKPEPDAVGCGEFDIFNDKVVLALDKSSPASVKPTDRKGDIGLVEFSNKFVETAPQIDEVKLGDCSGHKTERVQEVVKSEDGEDSRELSVDVTGTMLQVDEVKHGDLDSQKDFATMEGSLNVKDKNSDAVKKTDVPIRFFDLNLEHQKVSNSSNFSTNVSNSDGEKYDSHSFEERMSIAEGKKFNEVVLEDQFNDAHGFAVSPIASIEFDEDKDDAKDVSHIEEDVRSSLEVSKEHLVNDEDALVDDASLGGFGCLTPNKLLCGDGSKSIAEETSGSLHNNVDMVLCAGDSNESAEAQNFNDTFVSPPAGNVDSVAIPSFKFSANHGTTEHGASGFNVESCLFSSWEMNLFSGDDDVFAVDKLYRGTSETNYICEGSENSTEVKENATIMHAEVHHMEKKVQKSNDSLLAPFNEPIHKGEVSKGLKDVVVTMKENNYSEYSEKEVEFEKSSVPIHDMILTDITKMNGCEHAASAEPRAEGDSRYSVVENTANTDVVDAISIYLLEEEKCGERGEEIEPSEDVNSRMVDQAVDGGFPAEDAEIWQPKSESAQRKNSVAEMEKDNNLFAKQLNSIAKKRKDARASLIQGTPKKLITALDMKENAPSNKREHMGNATMVKSVTKRRALEDLQRK